MHAILPLKKLRCTESDGTEKHREWIKVESVAQHKVVRILDIAPVMLSEGIKASIEDRRVLSKQLEELTGDG